MDRHKKLLHSLKKKFSFSHTVLSLLYPHGSFVIATKVRNLYSPHFSWKLFHLGFGCC